MNEKDLQRNEVVEIDIGRVFRAIMDRVWTVVGVSIVCAVLVFIGTFFFVTPQYKSSAMFYVNNNSFSVGDASLSISSGDLVTSRNLVSSYIVILRTRETLNDVKDYAGVSRSYSELKGMISASSVDETEIFQVSVTSPDPNEAERIANAIAYILPKRIGTIIDGTSAKVVDSAVIPSRPSSPSYSKNAVLGFMIGFLLSAGVIALREIFDITIRSEEDVTQVCNHPILAAVPDMSAHTKGGSYYYYNSKSRYKYSSSAYEQKAAANAAKAAPKKGAYDNTSAAQKRHELMGPNISFAATEAYKLLRTKIQFSFTDEKQCRVIGLSSALSGEGKSLTAVNLAYTLSQLDKKVILVDCDMRRPTLADKLGIQKKPGLSSYLTSQSPLHDLIQKCNIKGDSEAFNVIAAGQNPPNPVELLSSAKMQRMLDKLRVEYDYVILDLPPVGEVTDAMAVANVTDGMLLVVRQNYCDRMVLGEAARQFAFIDAKILGTVFNCTSEHAGKYGKGYYKRYYKRYYRGYYRNSKYYARSHYYAKSSYENTGRSVAGAPSVDAKAKK